MGIHIKPLSTPLTATEPVKQPDPVDLRRLLDASEARVEALQREVGPYGPELGPVLLEAAREAAEYGAVEPALAMYRWALHNLRVNEGLNTRAQIDIIRPMLSLLRDTGDSQAVGSRTDYFFRMFGRGQPPYSDDKLAAAEAWMRVSIELLAGQDFDTQARRVTRFHDDARAIVDAVCEDPDWATAWCAPLSLQLLALLHLIDYRIDPLIEDEFNGGTARMRTVYDRRYEQAAPRDQRLYSLERGVRGAGKRLLERAISKSESSKRDRLRLALGDWLLFSGRVGPAMAVYRDLVSEHPSWFKVPIPLPAVGPIERDTRLLKDYAAIDARFEVTSRGKSRNADLKVAEGEGAEAEALLAFGRRHLRSLIFRPVLSDKGEATAAKTEAELLIMR